MFRPLSRASAPPTAAATLLTLALLAWSGHPAAQTPTPAAPRTEAAPLTLRAQSQWAPRNPRRSAVVLEAARAQAELGGRLQAQGQVRLRHGDTLLQCEALSYDEPSDEVLVPGQVTLQQGANRITGRNLRLRLAQFEGELLAPRFHIALTGGHGQAERLDLLGEQRMRAEDARYSSCEPSQPGGSPDWELRMRRLDLDLPNNEGRAQGAVLRFMGVPILTAPSFSFPLTDARKSGWLPPHFGVDNRSGFELAVPYYFNLAPNHDLTLTPFMMTSRGVGADVEWRGLQPWGQATWQTSLLPHDRSFGDRRWTSHLQAESNPFATTALANTRLLADVESVSDADIWKDLRRRVDSLTPRLLSRRLGAEHRWELPLGVLDGYLRSQTWQVLQTPEASTQVVAPYQREPQVGLRWNSHPNDLLLAGAATPTAPTHRSAHWQGSLGLEFNRFTLPSAALPTQATGGDRLHLHGQLAYPLRDPAWWLVPQLQLNAAAYRPEQPLADGRLQARQVVPTLALDAGLAFERSTTLFSQSLLQTLEPRLLFVQTPYRAQETLPLYDSAPRDFGEDTLYAVNPFTGADRVADAQQLSFGATSRWSSPRDGDELLRLSVVQRYQFRPQRISPTPGVTGEGFSDLLFAGAAHLSTPWWLEGTVQYNPDTQRVVRSVLRGRFSPGPYRSLSLAYRLARDTSEQLDLAWQWPLSGRARAARSSNDCSGAWYSAGRVQYSLRDRRVTDNLVGLEYDAGCWVLRMGVERLSTGLAEANTRFLIQLELVGLSRLGANALKVLKDNVPGYRPVARDSGPSSLP